MFSKLVMLLWLALLLCGGVFAEQSRTESKKNSLNKNLEAHERFETADEAMISIIKEKLIESYQPPPKLKIEKERWSVGSLRFHFIPASPAAYFQRPARDASIEYRSYGQYLLFSKAISISKIRTCSGFGGIATYSSRRKRQKIEKTTPRDLKDLWGGQVKYTRRSQVLNKGGTRVTFRYFIIPEYQIRVPTKKWQYVGARRRLVDSWKTLPPVSYRKRKAFYLMFSYDEISVNSKTLCAFETFLFLVEIDENDVPTSKEPEVVLGLAVDSKGKLLDEVPLELAKASNFESTAEEDDPVLPGITSTGCLQCHSSGVVGRAPDETGPIPWLALPSKYFNHEIATDYTSKSSSCSCRVARGFGLVWNEKAFSFDVSTKKRSAYKSAEKLNVGSRRCQIDCKDSKKYRPFCRAEDLKAEAYYPRRDRRFYKEGNPSRVYDHGFVCACACLKRTYQYINRPGIPINAHFPKR